MQAAKENFRVQTELSGCQLTSEMRNRLSFCLIINLELLDLAFLFLKLRTLCFSIPWGKVWYPSNSEGSNKDSSKSEDYRVKSKWWKNKMSLSLTSQFSLWVRLGILLFCYFTLTIFVIFTHQSSFNKRLWRFSRETVGVFRETFSRLQVPKMSPPFSRF